MLVVQLLVLAQQSTVDCPEQLQAHCNTFHCINKCNVAEAKYDLTGKSPQSQNLLHIYSICISIMFTASIVAWWLPVEIFLLLTHAYFALFSDQHEEVVHMKVYFLSFVFLFCFGDFCPPFFEVNSVFFLVAARPSSCVCAIVTRNQLKIQSKNCSTIGMTPDRPPELAPGKISHFVHTSNSLRLFYARGQKTITTVRYRGREKSVHPCTVS